MKELTGQKRRGYCRGKLKEVRDCRVEGRFFRQGYTAEGHFIPLETTGRAEVGDVVIYTNNRFVCIPAIEANAHWERI